MAAHAAVFGGVQGGRALSGGIVRAVSDGTATVPIGKAYMLDDIVQAHTDMEENRLSG